MSLPQAYFIDLFCGAGGTSTGIEHSRCFDKKVAKVIACVNHDANAIASHKENHPDCLHFTEDIRTLDLLPLITLVRHVRKINPTAKVYLWASLECTEYSKAKGGLARDADSRTLAVDLFRYTEAIDFDGVFIENVVEFMTGGPMRIKPLKVQPNPKMYTELTLIKDKKDKSKIKYGWEPLPEKKGEYYEAWVEKMKADNGYHFKHAILNAADFGAHTSRRRYFGIFVKIGTPIAFPNPTHSKKPTEGLQPWRPVKEVLDFSDEGKSIFGRKKDLSEATLERIYCGLIKYVANGETSYLQQYYSGRPMGKVKSIQDPCPSVTTFGGITIVKPVSLLKYNSRNQKTGKYVPPSLEDPCPTIPTQARLAIFNAAYIAYYYGQVTLSSVNEPCNTLRVKDTGQMVVPKFWIDRQFGHGGGKMSSIDEPIGALPTSPKAALASAWVLSPHFKNKGNSIDDPLNTITANGKYNYLMFPQWGTECTHSIEKPSPTLPASMDKMMPQFIEVNQTGTPIAIRIDESDSNMTKNIKIFMAAYGIVDIKMRMLQIKELKKITGFDEDYVLKGNQQEQKKYIGNAVPVLLAKAIIEGFMENLQNPLKKAA